jgi:hypothetical protein
MVPIDPRDERNARLLRKARPRAKRIGPSRSDGAFPVEQRPRIITSVEQNVLNWAKALVRAYPEKRDRAEYMLRSAVERLEKAEKLAKKSL